MSLFLHTAIRSHFCKFWLFLLIGLGTTIAFGNFAISLSAQAPLDNVKRDFVTMQTRMIEQWIDYQISGVVEGLQFLARRPVVVSTTIGETESNRQLLSTISEFDLISSLASVHVVDVLGDEIAKTVADSMWKAVFHQSEIIAAATSQLSQGKPWFDTRVIYGQNILLVAVPVVYTNSVEGAIVATLHLKISRNDFADIGLRSAELHNTVEEAGPTNVGAGDVLSLLPGSGLILKSRWDFTRLKNDRNNLVESLSDSLLTALVVAFAALGIIGHRLLLRPQKLLEESRLELVKSEQRARELATVAECANDAIVITDARGAITWVNKSMIQLSGYKLEEMLGQSPGQLLQGARTNDDTRNEISKALEQKTEIKAEILNYTKSGEPYWVELAISPVFGENKELTRFIAIERDVTDQKNRESELRDAHQRAQAANVAKSQFLATMSHEIRTPMNGVIGMLDMLQTQSLNDTAERYVNTARSSAETLLVIINDILDFSKVEAGKLDVEKIDVNLREMINDVCTILHESTRQKSILLYSTVITDASYSIHSDPVRVKQVLTNLLSNAIKFTDEGSVEVRLSVMPEQSMARVEILDTGVGIGETTTCSLFEAFQQEDNTTTRRFGGTGLGLAISKQLVNLMGGEIGYKTRPTKGTNFWFTLPLPALHANTIQTTKLSVVGNGNICLLSSDKLKCSIVTEELINSGFEVDSFSPENNPHDAIKENKYNIVIIDGEYIIDNALAVILKISQQDETQLITLGNNEPSTVLSVSANISEPFEFPAFIEQVMQVLNDEKTEETTTGSTRIPNQPQFSGRVLVVDDNPINQLVAETMLESLGLDVDLADDGFEAVDMAANYRYDLVLMDRHMPDRDGLETTRIIRSREQKKNIHTTIVALTASSMESDREHCINAGMDDFMTKPLTIESMTSTLVKWLRDGDDVFADAA